MYIFIITTLWVLLIMFLLIPCVRVCFRITSMAGTETSRDVKGMYTKEILIILGTFAIFHVKIISK